MAVLSVGRVEYKCNDIMTSRPNSEVGRAE